ncbi:hypothetical protein Lrub_0454 [Legionella rubrilucens]|uniref:Uncharacterized protein n=1 Tax=Legionella rubrilucens TaxID=458 RepID=A0A0W0XXB3_9GAMM|nr:hypothetical protein [Legionella rubrilucens]KTD49355.1 hypothetical protein Lrub_0454 [Legionella rubrilucens]
MNPYQMTINSKTLKNSGAHFEAGERSGAILTLPNKQTKLDFLEEFNYAVKTGFIEDKTPYKLFGQQSLYLSLEFASMLMGDPHADFSHLDELNQGCVKVNPVIKFFDSIKGNGEIVNSRGRTLSESQVTALLKL